MIPLRVWSHFPILCFGNFSVKASKERRDGSFLVIFRLVFEKLENRILLFTRSSAFIISILSRFCWSDTNLMKLRMIVKAWSPPQPELGPSRYFVSFLISFLFWLGLSLQQPLAMAVMIGPNWVEHEVESTWKNRCKIEMGNNATWDDFLDISVALGRERLFGKGLFLKVTTTLVSQLSLKYEIHHIFRAE